MGFAPRTGNFRAGGGANPPYRRGTKRFPKKRPLFFSFLLHSTITHALTIFFFRTLLFFSMSLSRVFSLGVVRKLMMCVCDYETLAAAGLPRDRRRLNHFVGHRLSPVIVLTRLAGWWMCPEFPPKKPKLFLL